MKNSLLFFILLFSIVSGFSQEKVLKGKIISKVDKLGIHIENLNLEIRTRADSLGYFSIKAQDGDALVFSSLNTKRKVFVVKEEHFVDYPTIFLQEIDIVLQEIKIDDKQEVLKTNVEKLSQAERQYKSSAQVANLNQGLDVNLDAIYNWVTGKRKDLKKAVEIEQIQKSLYKLDSFIESEFYTESLGIKPENVNDFKYFLVDDKGFLKVLDTNEESVIIIEAINRLEPYQKMKANEK